MKLANGTENDGSSIVISSLRRSLRERPDSLASVDVVLFFIHVRDIRRS